LQAENETLLQQLEESNRESYQVSEQFRQEMLAKNQKIAGQQSQLEQVRHFCTIVAAAILCWRVRLLQPAATAEHTYEPSVASRPTAACFQEAPGQRLTIDTGKGLSLL
jgi:hypothetical protein